MLIKKEKIVALVIGLGLAFLGVAVAVQAQGSGLSTSVLKPTDVGAAGDYNKVIPNVVTLVFVVAAALTFAYLIYGAVKWITSGGDTSKVESARGMIVAAVIGLLVLAGTWGIYTLVMQIGFGKQELPIPTLNS